MNIEQNLSQEIQQAFQSVFEFEIDIPTLQATNKEFAGDYTLVVFPFTKALRQKPEEIATQIGQHLTQNSKWVIKYNVVKGFLNLVLKEDVWKQTLQFIQQQPAYGNAPSKNQKVMVEFSSPNTNKPLHLGHLRNNFLGDSISRILKANGYEVVKANLVNDRGIHICKSMVAYEREGNNESPQSSGIKGDHLVGKYYVAFDKALRQETSVLQEAVFHSQEQSNTPYKVAFPEEIQKKIDAIVAKIKEQTDAKKIGELQGDLKQIIQNQTFLMREAKDLLQKWEAGESETYSLWQKMNGWVYEGFDETYEKIGISFDKVYHESETYLLGKDIIQDGLSKGVFYQEKDGSVWIDLSADKLDKKLLLRSDGTSVYMTQDLGAADLKYNDFKIDKSVYVVGNEQDYHFQVLFKILEKLDRPYAKGLYHLSYGMVDLPTGKMKSREGTVVDADDLIAQMLEIAKQKTDELGKADDFETEELQKLYHQIALGALKYYLLKVDPQKRMMFNPEESVDFEGDAGPFIQYNFARISSLLRKAEGLGIKKENMEAYTDLKPSEIALIQIIYNLPKKIEEAAQNYSPSIISQYVYEVAKTYSKFYNDCPVLVAETDSAKSFRLALSAQTAQVLEKAMGLLGIEMPKKM
jgi:arginyl-tRNA synthetase